MQHHAGLLTRHPQETRARILPACLREAWSEASRDHLPGRLDHEFESGKGIGVRDDPCVYSSCGGIECSDVVSLGPDVRIGRSQEAIQQLGERLGIELLAPGSKL